MKKLLIWMLSATLCVSLTACAGPTPPESPIEETTESTVEETPESPIEETPESSVEETAEFPVEETPENGAVSAEILQTLFTGVTGYRGRSGSSLRDAQNACNLLAFAENADYANVSLIERAEAVSDACAAMSDEEREEFVANFDDIRDLMGNAFGDYDSVRPVFDDAGVADTMDALMKADDARMQWDALASDIPSAAGKSASDLNAADSPYSFVTTLPAKDVEEFASKARQAYLDEDWQTLSAMIRYPITMYPDVKVNNSQEFLSYMSDKVIAKEDRAEMEEEDCKNLFANGQGICMATGSIWFLDVNFNGIDQLDAPSLRIISVSGLEKAD